MKIKLRELRQIIREEVREAFGINDTPKRHDDAKTKTPGEVWHDGMSGEWGAKSADKRTAYFKNRDAADRHSQQTQNLNTEAVNTQSKTRPESDPYEVWMTPDHSWTWKVLKKWQADDDKPYARWFCQVISPMTPEGEMGDVYVKDIKSHARKVSGKLVQTSDKPIPKHKKEF